MIKNALIAALGTISLIAGNFTTASNQVSEEEMTEISQTKKRLENFLQVAIEQRPFFWSCDGSASWKSALESGLWDGEH